MNNFQTKRIMLLMVSGGFLIGGGLYWACARQAPAQMIAALPPGLSFPINLPAIGNWPWLNDKLNPDKQAMLNLGNNDATVPNRDVNAGLSSALQTSPAIQPSSGPLPVERKTISATSRAVAASDARLGAGRSDPFASVGKYQSFPHTSKTAIAFVRKPDSTVTIQPPPSITQKTSVDIACPTTDSGKPPEDPITQLPPPVDPPDKPTLADKMQLVGVIGDHVLMNVRQKAPKNSQLPPSLTLGQGEKFDSLSVVNVTNDSVTLDEDGKQTVRTIAPIR